MLRDFGRSLSEAISDSSEASRRLRAIRDQGYSLFLLLDDGLKAAETDSSATPLVGGDEPEFQPDFRINGNDLSFLRSIGIDPTRRLKSRR